MPSAAAPADVALGTKMSRIPSTTEPDPGVPTVPVPAVPDRIVPSSSTNVSEPEATDSTSTTSARLARTADDGRFRRPRPGAAGADDGRARRGPGEGCASATLGPPSALALAAFFAALRAARRSLFLARSFRSCFLVLRGG